MTVITIYLWGVGIGAVIAVLCGIVGWRNGVPLATYRSNEARSNDVVTGVGELICFALVWPYLALLGTYSLWKRLTQSST
jgi:hypothetical protein